MESGADRAGSSKNVQLYSGDDGESSLLLLLTATLLISNGESTRWSKLTGDL
jgi:hypothetical protein